ncbi:hypothetical protein GC175_04925 [bacterium]|nr:hypothetical protein [bacterium]
MTDNKRVEELYDDVTGAASFMLERIDAYIAAGGSAQTFSALRNAADKQEQLNILVEVSAAAAVENNKHKQEVAALKERARADWQKEQQRRIEERARAKEKKDSDWQAAGRRLIDQVKAAATGGK